jgi:thiamine pyrophosphate-dependent acetolactate synthase large subunit-like protein
MPNGARLEEVANLRGRLSKEKEEPRHGSTPEYPIKPQLIFRELSQILTRKDIVVLDEGNAVSYAYHHLKFFEPRTLVAPLDLACIGSGYPTALGAKVARPDRRVFAVCGDGGFIMALHELATAVQYDIKVIAVVLNNNSWVAEKAYQKYYYSGRYFGVDLLNPSFAQVARDFGLTGIRVERQGDLRAGLLEAVESSKPSLVEVMVDPEELNPPARRDIMRA